MKNLKLAAFISLVFIKSLFSQTDVTLTIPSDITASPGNFIETPILLSTDSLINQVQITLDYDSTKLNFIEAEIGPFITGFTISTSTNLALKPPTAGTNKNVMISFVADGNASLTGIDVEILTIRWQVSGFNGNASVYFDPVPDRSFLTTVHTTNIGGEQIVFNPGLITIFPDTTAILSLDTDTSDVLENEVFEIQLYVSQVADLHQFNSAISFDPQIIRVDSVKAGNFLSNAGQEEITWTPPVLDNTNGLVTNIQAARLDTFGVFGGGVLARLYFHSLLPGKSQVRFSQTESNLNDPENNIIPVAAFSDLEVNIYREPVAELALPDTFAAQNRYIDLPLSISGVGDVAIISALIEVEFDTSCLKGIDVISQGTLTQNWQTPVVNNRDTSFYFALAGASPLTGDGILVYLRFYINPLAEENDQCELRFVDVLLNEGDPTTITQPGSFRVRGLQIAGSVDYQGTGLPVPFVEFALSGYRSLFNQTDENGNFNFTRLHYGDYILTPTKLGDQGRAISPFDAALVLQHVVGSSQLNAYQKIAADVTGDSTVSAFDASYIMRYTVELEEKFPIMADAENFWEFVPAAFSINDENWFAHPNTIPYIPLEKDEFNQNFVGVIYGDVSQNWTSPALQSNIAEGSKSIARVRSGDLQILDGQRVSMPIILEQAEAVHSVELEINFKASEIEFLNVSQSNQANKNLMSYNATNNLLKIALASAEPLEPDGEILSVQFRVKNSRLFSPEENIFIQGAKLNDNPTAIVSSVTGAVNPVLPERLALLQNYPNPFNQSTVFRVEIPQLGDGEEVSLKIYNVTGQLVRTLMQGNSQPGSVSVHWNGTDNANLLVSSGEYFAVLEAGQQRIVQRFILLR